MKHIKFIGVQDTEFQNKVTGYHGEFLEKIEAMVIKPKSRKTIEVLLNWRMKSYAGWANYRDMTIKLNHWLLYKDDQALRDTYGHELAHLITRDLHGYKVLSHGPEWKRTMRVLGLVPKRCHKFSRAQMAKMKKEYQASGSQYLPGNFEGNP